MWPTDNLSALFGRKQPRSSRSFGRVNQATTEWPVWPQPVRGGMGPSVRRRIPLLPPPPPLHAVEANTIRLRRTIWNVCKGERGHTSRQILTPIDL
ncbi:unnamed protein product [Protopolystoma xenopodis]|uniref:Uncharacterized protein n=1 Tax=Protopolystoma xenopodis TaxID=117903 RepID=A0A448XLA3_9PLAT|nr:unnamed protein product [Protopolystoma xenopodis]